MEQPQQTIKITTSIYLDKLDLTAVEGLHFQCVLVNGTEMWMQVYDENGGLVAERHVWSQEQPEQVRDIVPPFIYAREQQRRAEETYQLKPVPVSPGPQDAS